ncbi:MAG: class I SAM-dependent methyltransferase [Gemmatimonadota bacterium]
MSLLRSSGSWTLPDAWSSVARSYLEHIVPGFLPAVRALADALAIGPGDRVIDIACGPGTAAFVALEHGAAHVTGVDYAPGMVALARERAAGLANAAFLAGEAGALPVADASYDVAISSFGLIFAPEPARAVAEMARVLVAGGRFGLLAWAKGDTTEAYYEQVYRHLPRPKASHEPYDWGIKARAREWLSGAFADLTFHDVAVPLEARSPEAAWTILKRSTGRVAAQYANLPADAQTAMDRDLEAWFAQWVRPDGTVHWPRQARIITGAKAP